MEELKIFNIINAKGSGKLYHEKDPRFSYMRWHIEGLTRFMNYLQEPQSVLNFFDPVHDFIERCLLNGENVMVHCLAGAHRAGTTGVSYMMRSG